MEGFGDTVSTAQPDESPHKNFAKNLLGEIADITGGGELSKGYAQVLGGGADALSKSGGQLTQNVSDLINEAKKFPVGNPRRTQLLEQAKQISGQLGQQAKQFLTEIPTNKQVIGSAVQLGTTIGAAGLGAPTAKTALGRIGQTAGQLGGLGAVAGGAEAYKQNAPVIKGALAGGATGAALGGAGSAIAELAHYLTSSGVTEGLYNKVLGIPKKVIERGKSPSGMLLEEGIGGTKSGILKQAQTIATDSESQISKILQGNPTQISSKGVIEEIQSELQQKFQNSLSADEIKSIVDKLPINSLRTNAKLSISRLNALRSELDNSFLGNAKWLNESSVEKTLALKTATNVMRNIVQKADKTLPNLFSRWSGAITTTRALRSELAKPHIMTNLLEILGSLVYSAPVGTGVARLLKGAGEIGGGATGKILTGIAKTLVPGIAKKMVISNPNP